VAKPAGPGTPVSATSLSSEQRMLVKIRDTLYEGSWEDFANDLRDRLAGRPHVFETMPASPRLRETIGHHLTLIEEMARWEQASGVLLSADPT